LTQDQFALIERGEPLFGLADFVFYRTDTICSLDQLLVELAPVIADQFDFLSKLGLVLRRPLLVGTDRGQFLVALLERVEPARRGGRRRNRTSGPPQLGRGNGRRDRQGSNPWEHGGWKVEVRHL